MRVLRISLTDGKVGPYGEFTDRKDCDPRRFWDQWNSPLARGYWHRTELDRDGNPFTVKWRSTSFVNSSKVRVGTLSALEVEGAHPANTLPTPLQQQPQANVIPSTQLGRQLSGTRLRSPQGMWTVVRSWYVYLKDQDREHCKYLLVHEDGREEEWWASDMADADFHRILPEQQQTLI